MKIKLHHVNFCSTNVPALEEFYRTVLDLEPEPSMGAGRIRDEQGISVLFIEQNVELSLKLADRGVVLESGRTVLSGAAAELLRSPEVKRIFLGDFAL